MRCGFWTLICLGSQSLLLLPVGLTIGSLALYRMALFTHEICHFKAGILPGFASLLNAVCGIPMSLSSYMLKSHVDHHPTRSYGKPADPEYLPFATYPQLRSHFLVGSALVPLAMLLWALIVVPLASVNPKVQGYLRERMTFISMKSVYRPGPHKRLTLGD